MATSMGKLKSVEPDWLAEYKARRQRALNLCLPEHRRGQENHDFAAGLEQWSKDDVEAAKALKFATLTIPEIVPIIDTASGTQILRRFQRVYIPLNRSEQGAWAELMTEVDRAFMEASDVEIEESEAFRDGPCVQGLSCLRWSLEEDSGERSIRIERTPMDQVLWPADEAYKKNLTDRNWQIFGEWYPLQEALDLWPDQERELRGWRGVGWGPEGGGTAMSSRVEWEGGPGSSEGFGDPKEARDKMVWVEHYEWREWGRKVRIYAAVPQPGMPKPPVVSELIEDEFEELSRLAESEGRPIDPAQTVRMRSRIYRYAKVVGGGVVLESGPIDVGAFTFEFITGRRHSQKGKTRWLGMVDLLKDPQRWVNTYLSSMARMFQHNPKGALVTERGVFKNRQEAVRQWTSPSGVIEVERGKLTGPTRPFETLTGQHSPAFQMADTLMGYAKEAMPRIASISPGVMGQLGPDLRRISSSLVEGLRDAAIAGNADAYDSYALMRRRGGRLFLKFLKEYFEPEDVIRVVGDKAFRTVVDPMTQMPQQISIIPPKHMWDPSAWKAISIAETGPTPDQIEATWEGLVKSGALDVLTRPDPMTGRPIFTAKDIVQAIPRMPQSWRDKKLAEIEQQEIQAQMMPPQQGPPPEQTM